jgi:ADP-heptose:LPS heptosyltransferase/GT2 family glycosyltransferase
VFVDGRAQGRAHHGIRREDVQTAFPDDDALLSGFAMLVPPQALKPGRHDVRIVFRDRAGHVEETGFSITAEPAAEGPGPWQLRRKIPQSEIDMHSAMLAAAGWQPAWTLLLRLPRPTEAAITQARATLRSLRHHAYADWRLAVIVPGDADIAPLAASLLDGLDDLRPRIALRPANPALALADLVAEDGMLALLAPGDRLGEDALLELSLAAAVEGHHGARPDFLYSDERRIDPADGTLKAFFKPDWSPDLLLSTNYIGRLWAASRALLRRTGLNLGGLLRHGEFDAVLRLTEQALDHPARGGAALDHPARGGAALDHPGRERGALDDPRRERAALRRAAGRRGMAASVYPGCLAGTWRLQRDVAEGGLVSIIIPTIAAAGLVRTTIETIRARTAWPRTEIVVLDNIGDADDPQKRFWKHWLSAQADTLVELREPFNWSRLNNIGAQHARGDYLLFLNDDIEVSDPYWLHGLLEHAQRPEVGVVGPQLLYPDGRVQQAGMFLSRDGGRHAFRFYQGDAPGPFGLARTQRNVIAVTGACMLVRRAVFDELGGFDEAHAVVNNDIDFALRLRRSGRLVVYTPHVTLIHHEMASRSKLKDEYHSPSFEAAWKDLFLQGDPYFHPLLSSDDDDYPVEAEPLRQFQVGHPLIAREAVRRILVVKLDHIGDFVAAFPAFRRLKQVFPHAELCVLAASASVPLAAMEPAIDRMLEFNFFHPQSERGPLDLGEADLQALQTRLEPMLFDLAIDLRRQSDTRPILQRSGARWLAGFDMAYANPWLDISLEFEGDVAHRFKRSHVSDALVQLVDAVGRACESDRRGVAAPLGRSEARAALADLPSVREIAEAMFARPLVCVHTGAGALNKQWPAASFAGLIDLLVGEAGVNVAIIGGADEAAFAARVIADLRRPEQVFSLIGGTTLQTLPWLLLASELYVGNDSGPKHIAAALGVPTIGIHSGSVDAGEWGPLGPAALTLRRDMTCGPCYIQHAKDCPRSLACLTGIAVGDVFRACRRMLVLSRYPRACNAAARRQTATQDSSAKSCALSPGANLSIAPFSNPGPSHSTLPLEWAGSASSTHSSVAGP